MGTEAKMAQKDGDHQTRELIERVGRLDINTSSLNDLQLANIVPRRATQIVLREYHSDDDDSDADEEDGRLVNERFYHDNGNPRFFRTYQARATPEGSSWERVVEEKHFDVDGVCRMDVHFALGQPYLYRKHYHHNQRLKSETVFWVEDERELRCRKIGWWRTYYETGNVRSEIQYNDKGVRIGFAKRYGHDGTIEWVKDYTREYQERADDFNERKGQLDFGEVEAAKLLGFSEVPPGMSEVNSRYRVLCAPLHPDKKPDPEATAKFIRLSRARDVLKAHYDNPGSAANGV